MSVLNFIKTKAQRIIQNAKYRIFIKNKNFTLIAQNCVGGVIYSFLGLEFKSPTINMFIEDMNFVKLVKNPSHYLSIDAKPYNERFQDPIDNTIVYPQIIIDDVVVTCLHYKNCTEAVEAWNRRRQRVNLDNIYVIGNSWNMHEDYNLVSMVANLENAVVFTYKPYEHRNCVHLKGDFWKLDKRSIIRPNITDSVPNSGLKYFELNLDLISFFKRK